MNQNVRLFANALFFFSCMSLYLPAIAADMTSVENWLRGNTLNSIGKKRDAYSLAVKFVRDASSTVDRNKLDELFDLGKHKNLNSSAFSVLTLRMLHSIVPEFRNRIEQFLVSLANDSRSKLSILALNELLSCKIHNKENLTLSLNEPNKVILLLKHLILLKNGKGESNPILLSIISELSKAPLIQEERIFDAANCLEAVINCDQITDIGKVLFEKRYYTLSKLFFELIEADSIGISQHENTKCAQFLKKFQNNIDPKVSGSDP